MRLFLIFLITIIALSAQAEWVLAPRLESVSGKRELARRLLVKSKVSFQQKNVGVFFEGFYEHEELDAAIKERRLGQQSYLQEAYGELRFDRMFLRLGRQSLRWSEMWVVPSLDIFSGRRWSRLFFDPFADQLTHSTGLSGAWLGDTVTLESFYIAENAENPLPQPLPSSLEEGYLKTHGGGARLKIDWLGSQISILAASVKKDLIAGATANYAFEHSVPKLEFGVRRRPDEKLNEQEPYEQYFGAVGVDLFLGDWVITPQWTMSEGYDESLVYYEPNYFWYIGATWKRNRHDLSIQYFKKQEKEDQFFNFVYNYYPWDSIGLGGFIQGYEGSPGTLFGIYKEMTQGTVFGIRLEYTGVMNF